nr:MAG TPA: hypothetical protein [Caudoviricetes sp.]
MKSRQMLSLIPNLRAFHKKYCQKYKMQKS